MQPLPSRNSTCSKLAPMRSPTKRYSCLTSRIPIPSISTIAVCSARIFLSQFDMLIDNAHSLLCLDDSAAMRADVKGPHIALLPLAETTSGDPSFRSLIISARLSDGMRPVRLKLDSGTNAPFLFDRPQYMAPGSIRSVGGGLNGAQRSFSTLPPQDLKIGSLKFPNVSFATFADSQRDSRTSAFDGLLTLGLFRSVFICHADHFAVFEPW